MRFISSFIVFTFLYCHSLTAQDYQFTVFDMSNTTSFTTDFFRGIAVGKYGHVWVGSNKNGLYRYNGVTWEKASVLQDHSIRALYMAPIDSTIWVAQSGKSSSGGNTNINGGVNNILDTLYNFNYYGAISGLPSRACYGIYVNSADRAWSVHGPHLNGSDVSGGGFGNIELGVADQIFEGLPSGNYSEDVYCSSIGSGTNASEIWVGVKRSCYSGNCDSAYIAKYDTDGNFLGKITGSNSPLPFDNTSSGPTAKAIDFDIDGRAWVGLSSGDIYVFDGEYWNYINEENSVIPTGASIHAQAITHNEYGQVYIGTTLGLLVYNGGELLQSSSYQFLTTEDGLPTNNITGVCFFPGNELWLSTGAGVVLAEQTVFPISGQFYNVNFSMATGEYTYFAQIPQTNTIEAHPESDPSTSISEMIEEDGSFYFENDIDPYDSYRIHTVFDDDFWSDSELYTEYEYNYHNTIPGTTGLEIYIPQKILDNLYDRMLNLESENYVPIGDIEIYQEFMQQLGYGPNENVPEDVYHTIARVIIADRHVYMLDSESEALISTSVEMFSALIKLFYDAIKKVLNKVPDTEDEKVDKLRAKMIGYLIKQLNLTSSLENLLSKSNLSVVQKAFVKGMVYDSEEKFKKELLLGAGIEAAKFVAKEAMHYYYKKSVNDSVGNNTELVQMVKEFDYHNTTEEAFKKVISLTPADNSMLYTTIVETTEAISAAEALKLAQEDLDFIANFIDLFAGKNPKFYAVVQFFKTLNIISQTTATLIAANQTYKTYDAAVDGPYVSLNPYIDYNSNKSSSIVSMQNVYDNNRIAGLKSDFGELKQQIIMKLDSMLYYISINNQSSAESMIADIIELDTDLNSALLLYKAPIVAKSQNAVQQIPEFDSIFTDLLLLEQYYNFDNVGAMIWMSEYLEDEDFENDTLNLSVDSLKMSLDALDTQINLCLELTEDIEAPAFIAVSDHWTEGEIISNESFQMKAKIKNMGAFEADNIYIQLKMQPSVSISTDSIIFIGTMQADEEVDVEWTVELLDEEVQLLNYNISIDSTLALTQFANSMLIVSDYTVGINEEEFDNINPLEFYPNPNNGVIHIHSQDLPEGNVEIEILDIMGKVVHQELIRNTRTNAEIVVSLDSGLPEGIYFIQARINGLRYSNKIVIN